MPFPVASMLSYPATIPLSTRTLNQLPGLIRDHRQACWSQWRRLDAGQQALMALANFRNGDSYRRLAAGLAIGISTVYRYLREAIDLLATQAIPLHRAVYLAARLIYIILDGTPIPIDRIAADRPYYSGKHRRHGVNVQILSDSRGRPLWASPAMPSAVDDVKAARRHGIPQAMARFGVACCADTAYKGADPTITVPFRRRPRRLSRNQKAVKRNHARNRAPGERGRSHAQTWKIFSHFQLDWAGQPVLSSAGFSWAEASGR